MLLSREELDASAEPHPQFTEFYGRNTQPPRSNDPHVSRAGLRALIEANLARIGPAPSSISEFYHEIPMRDGHLSSLKIVKPSSGAPGPLIVLLFGGGFIAGDNDQLTETARICVTLFGTTAVNISYRVGPEHKFPYGQHDALDSLEWITENAESPLLHSDPRQGFLIGGISAGASISVALSRKFQAQPLLHPLTGQWLSVPSLMHVDICPEEYKAHYISMNQDGPTGLTKEDRDMMQAAVQWDKDSDLRYAANSTTQISGQPRTYLQVDGMDPLRDDGLVYDEMLKDAGVVTKIDFYPGCPHAHWVPLRGYEVGNKALIDAIVGIGWLLGQSAERKDVAKLLGVSPA